MVETSTRKSGKKNSPLYRIGEGGIGGYVLPITIRSNGSSNIIGAVAAPTNVLPREVFHSYFLVICRTMRKVATVASIVTGAIRFVA